MYKFKNLVPTKEELQAMQIIELRKFAREIGVERPVSLTKSQLVESILKIIKGE